MQHGAASAAGSSAAAASASAAAESMAAAAVSSSPHAASSAASAASDAQVAALERVLRHNDEYQSFLQSQLGELQLLLSSNAEKRRLVEQIQSRSDAQQKQQADVTRRAIFQAPFFVDQLGNTPPDNADTIRKRRLRGSMPLVHKFVTWSSEERRHLQEAVLVQNRKAIMQSALSQSKALVQRGGAGAGRDAKALVEQANARIQSLHISECELAPNEIDWNHASSKYVRSRSALECKIQWMNNDDPNINRDPWDKDEDGRLLKAAEQHRMHNWVDIASQLGTNRTAMQCFQRFQRCLNPALILSKWSPGEDALLRKLVLQYGEKDWKTVAVHFQQRTDMQCMGRWLKSVNPTIRSGRWNKTEDNRLRLARQAYMEEELTGGSAAAAAAAAAASGDGSAGGAASSAAAAADVPSDDKLKSKGVWNRVALHVPGRTDMKCRERWCNVLDAQLAHGQWSAEEDEKLKRLVKEHGMEHWSRIARELRPRTDDQCRRRWNKVADPADLRRRHEQIEKKKSNVVRNAVGRQKERTKLSVDDLTMLNAKEKGDGEEAEEKQAEAATPTAAAAPPHSAPASAPAPSVAAVPVAIAAPPAVAMSTSSSSLAAISSSSPSLPQMASLMHPFSPNLAAFTAASQPGASLGLTSAGAYGLPFGMQMQDNDAMSVAAVAAAAAGLLPTAQSPMHSARPQSLPAAQLPLGAELVNQLHAATSSTAAASSTHAASAAAANASGSMLEQHPHSTPSQPQTRQRQRQRAPRAAPSHASPQRQYSHPTQSPPSPSAAALGSPQVSRRRGGHGQSAPSPLRSPHVMSMRQQRRHEQQQQPHERHDPRREQQQQQQQMLHSPQHQAQAPPSHSLDDYSNLDLQAPSSHDYASHHGDDAHPSHLRAENEAVYTHLWDDERAHAHAHHSHADPLLDESLTQPFAFPNEHESHMAPQEFMDPFAQTHFPPHASMHPAAYGAQQQQMAEANNMATPKRKNQQEVEGRKRQKNNPHNSDDRHQ